MTRVVSLCCPSTTSMTVYSSVTIVLRSRLRPTTVAIKCRLSGCFCNDLMSSNISSRCSICHEPISPDGIPRPSQYGGWSYHLYCGNCNHYIDTGDPYDDSLLSKIAGNSSRVTDSVAG